MSDKKITDASISPLPKQWGDPMPVVTVTLEDGGSMELFSYFPDEISFRPAEFIGLTIEQAHKLRFNKDRGFLQS